MGASDYLWLMIKIGVVAYIIKKILNKIAQVIIDKILYVPIFPSIEYRYPENNPPGCRSPKEYGYDFEDIEIVTKDQVKLSGWFIYHKNPTNYPTVIFFHGNAGNIGTRLPNIQLLFDDSKVNVVIVGYRGYGHSQGSASEYGLQLDSEAVLDWTVNCSNVDNTKIFVYGCSMGGAVTIYLSTKRQHDICGIILENTFTSIRDMADIIVPKSLRFLKTTFLPNVWPSIDRINTITIPILFISGRKGRFNPFKNYKDSLIPCAQMDKLYKYSQNSSYLKMYKVKDGEHNDTWARDIDNYYREFSGFIDKALKKKIRSSKM